MKHIAIALLLISSMATFLQAAVICQISDKAGDVTTLPQEFISIEECKKHCSGECFKELSY